MYKKRNVEKNAGSGCNMANMCGDGLNKSIRFGRAHMRIIRYLEESAGSRRNLTNMVGEGFCSEAVEDELLPSPKMQKAE